MLKSLSYKSSNRNTHVAKIIKKGDILNDIDSGMCSRIKTFSYKADDYVLNKNKFYVLKLYYENISKEHIERELSAYSRFKHSNIMSVHYFDDAGIIMDYGVPLSSLKIRLSKYLLHLYGSIKALDYIHELGFIHMDFKPDNIIIVDGVAKLIDFGGCIEDPSKNQNVCVSKITYTEEYASPEIILSGDDNCASYKKLSFKHDMWSVGVVIYYACYSKYPIFDENKNLITNNIINYDVIITKLLCYNPDERMNTKECLQKLSNEIKYIK
jgi:serine/threonine protein kinase